MSTALTRTGGATRAGSALLDSADHFGRKPEDVRWLGAAFRDEVVQQTYDAQYRELRSDGRLSIQSMIERCISISRPCLSRKSAGIIAGPNEPLDSMLELRVAEAVHMQSFANLRAFWVDQDRLLSSRSLRDHVMAAVRHRRRFELGAFRSVEASNTTMTVRSFLSMHEADDGVPQGSAVASLVDDGWQSSVATNFFADSSARDDDDVGVSFEAPADGDEVEGATNIRPLIHKVLRATTESASLVFGSPENDMPQHDRYDRIFLQVAGRKQWVLTPPMSDEPGGSASRRSGWSERLPRGLTFDLFPGDVAYVPAGWRHKTASNGTTVGILASPLPLPG